MSIYSAADKLNRSNEEEREMMSTRTTRVLFAALMLGAASGALAGDGSSYGGAAEMRSPAHAVEASRAKRQIAPRAYGANAYRPVAAPSRQLQEDWPRMNCDLPIGC
jgi:hypothetical protein